MQGFEIDTAGVSARRLKLAVSSTSILLNSSESSLMQQEDRRERSVKSICILLFCSSSDNSAGCWHDPPRVLWNCCCMNAQTNVKITPLSLFCVCVHTCSRGVFSLPLQCDSMHVQSQQILVMHKSTNIQMQSCTDGHIHLRKPY